MKGSRFSEEQIIGVLREHEAGAKTEEVCRKHGISSATFYKWKAKYGGLEVSDSKRLTALEDENANTPIAASADHNGAGTLRYVGGSAPRPVAPPSPLGSNTTGTLP